MNGEWWVGQQMVRRGVYCHHDHGSIFFERLIISYPSFSFISFFSC